MSDVAREAGVSLATVSRAINEPEKLSAEKLALVRAAVERLGYVPNLNAGSLASAGGKSRIVAAIVPTVANVVFSETVDALAQTLARGGYQLLLGQTSYRSGDEEGLVEAFLGRRVDGLVLTGTTQSASLRAKLKRAGIPVVQTWDLMDKPIDMLVGFSNFEVGRAAAEHLIARGHRGLGFIGAQEERSRQRLEGFRAGAAAHGVADVQAELILPPVDIADAGPRFAQMASRCPELNAVFCNNDMLAAGVVFECHQRGWAVPQRMAVLGLGDLPIARAAFPRLSTVEVRRGQIGTRAGQMLLSRLSGERSGADIVDLGFEVVTRAST
ncbi:LacI family DNA-binding transcriptional regulator [Azohydromonas lata]|uniref:LacI family DNA-binding transcriptional regulator n=1 Tax=Azohydromonas lata TaxID=45677 RepID=A0ABU5ICS0_9BURK|nr:LacI family DNA-binding transcriptional regulator [Azohydromonas lata]MDZ5455763.1 LacI family DNA-binding transcriptional regulator [Azohydromonas lata]